MDHISTYANPQLRSPALIAAFGGWNDASEVATFAARFLIQQWQARKMAEVDPEEFYVFTETRPHVRIAGRIQRRVDWPANEFYYHANPQGERDVIVLIGVEPHLKWRTFAHALTSFCRQQGITAVITMGALVADVPHTLPVSISGTGSPQWLGRRLRRLGVESTRYEGPTGIVGVLNAACARRCIPTASLWGSAPEYLSASPNPKVALALLEALDGLLDLGLDLAELRDVGAQFDRQVSELVAEDQELQEYVRRLEDRTRAARAKVVPAEEQRAKQEPLPSGEELIRELEEYLRRRRAQGGHS